MGGILQIASEGQLQAEDQRKIDAKVEAGTSSINDPFLTQLAGHVRSAWTEARSEKNIVTKRMLEDFRQYKNQYDPEKLVAIRTLKGSEVFLPVTNIKCRAGEAWLRETLLQPTSELWDIQPTPIPELPESKMMEMRNQMIQAYESMMQMALFTMQATGQQVNEPMIKEQMKNLQEELEKKFKDEVMNEAKEAAEEMKKQINDQFTEGGFYGALDEAIHDITIFPTCFVKGPIFQRKRKLKRSMDFNTGQWSTSVEYDIKESYKRVSPFNIFPAPDSNGINDGYLIELDSTTPKALYDMIGLEGFNELSIRHVIQKYRENGLTEWALTDELARKRQENKFNIWDSDKIDMLVYWGSVRGELLMDWGMKDREIDDREKYYDVCVWLIDNVVIKAMLNPDPLGYKPYSKASFVEIPDAFWGMSIPEIIRQIQIACNAIARASINNIGIASGPLVERNIDRVPPHETKVLYPWKVLDSTDAQMSTSPAYRFYQPSLMADQLITVLGAYLKMADELSGIPAYAHGDITVGGAGRTATGLSMLTANASRGIKAVIRNIDKGIIEDMIERQYNLNMELGRIRGAVPDTKVVAKGSIALAEKELESVRRVEFLQQTMNPMDAQILGMEGRKQLLKEVAKAYGMNVDKLFPDGQFSGMNPDIMQMLQGGEGGSPGSAPPKKGPSSARNQPKPGVDRFGGK